MIAGFVNPHNPRRLECVPNSWMGVCLAPTLLASDGMATTNSEVQIVGGDYRAKLGESPVWINGELVFIDVVAKEICTLRDGTVRRAQLPKMPGSIVPSSKGGFLAALAVDADGSGGQLRRVVLRYDDTGTLEADTSEEFFCNVLDAQVHRPLADKPEERQCLNDGKCDARGRVWVGSKVLGRPDMDARYVQAGPDTPTGSGNDESNASSAHFSPSEDAPPAGALFCVEPAFSYRNGSMVKVGVAGAVAEVGGVWTSNGIAWSPVGDTMYYADSPRRRVEAYDFCAESGLLRNGRVFARMPDDVGVPDGMCVDENGGVWVCVWDAGKVVRYVPDGEGNAKLDRTIAFPCSRPTSCCFGGANGTTLFVTSCSLDTTVDADAKDLSADEPTAGGVFAIDVGVKGVRVHAAAF